jgi:hypothetical protein
MASKDYLLGRKKWSRPQAMLWSDSAGTLVDGIWVPTGYEKLSDETGLSQNQLDNSFIILSDHNRGEITINTQRIEQRKRMINGTMRSYHNADKLVINTSWAMLPSRSHSVRPNFNQNTGLSIYNKETPERPADGSPYTQQNEYTADGGAGGNEMLTWYQEHTGPFWVYLAYDKYSEFGDNSESFGKLAQYNQVLQMYLASFDYTVVKRGGSNHDMWNISISLEEV